MATLTPSADAQVVNVRTDQIVTGLSFPTYVTAAPADTSRLYILQKGGTIRIFDLTTNTLLPTPFLSVVVAGGISESDERGLLGLTFDPGYAKNGQFYIYYTGTNTNVVARYTRSAANPNVANATGVIVMSWADPFTNHNGGWMGFGPDGNLYIGVGDGGSANDPNGNGQNLSVRLAKMHRIKPTVGGVAPYYTIPSDNPFVGGVTTDDEVWAYGLRNPWRSSFDRATGDLWIGDVGQNAIEEIDWSVGQILTTLQELKIDDNTLVIFTSDNGPQPGAWKDIFVDFFDGAAGLRGSKTNFYEGGIREPMLARWPGHIRPGSVTDHVGYFPDFMPTLAEIAGASAHLPATDGISFAPTLLGRPEQKTHDFLYWEAAGADRNTLQQAVRWGDWKAVKPGARAAWELYNLKQDERETADVAARHPDVMRQIAAIVAREHTPERAYPPAIKEGVADFVR